MRSLFVTISQQNIDGLDGRSKRVRSSLIAIIKLVLGCSVVHSRKVLVEFHLYTRTTMSKNIVICCDGTGNEVEGNLSNVLKLYRILPKNENQRVYYTPGIGTIGTDDNWTRVKQNTKSVFELATGYGLDDDILGGYAFICKEFEERDSIFLFGFSRGAYAVRALAGFIHMVGLLQRDQLNVANYALTAYKRSSQANDFSIAWNFSKIIGSRRATIKFIGVWDTVASVLVPRPDRIIPTLQTLPYTRTNKSVEVFRHAMAIDEKRRMFRLNRWSELNRSSQTRSTPRLQNAVKTPSRYGSPARTATSGAVTLNRKAAYRSFLLHG
jgi:uncharacterized protein (DUF2235 family)